MPHAPRRSPSARSPSPSSRWFCRPGPPPPSWRSRRSRRKKPMDETTSEMSGQGRRWRRSRRLPEHVLRRHLRPVHQGAVLADPHPQPHRQLLRQQRPLRVRRGAGLVDGPRLVRRPRADGAARPHLPHLHLLEPVQRRATPRWPATRRAGVGVVLRRPVRGRRANPSKATCTCPVDVGPSRTLGGDCNAGACDLIWSAATPAGDVFANQHYYDWMTKNQPGTPVNQPARRLPRHATAGEVAATAWAACPADGSAPRSPRRRTPRRSKPAGRSHCGPGRRRLTPPAAPAVPAVGGAGWWARWWRARWWRPRWRRPHRRSRTASAPRGRRPSPG